MRKTIELESRHGAWRIIAVAYKSLPRLAFLCQCACGNRHIVRADHLRSGASKGCLRCAAKARELPKRALDSGFRNILYEYKKSAQSRGLEFELADDEFLAIIRLACHYCGEPPSRQVGGKKWAEKFNGVDRKANNIGYIFNNCLPCCRKCNHAKRDMSYDDFLSWVLKVATHNTLSRLE